jgi:hypothetical protein
LTATDPAYIIRGDILYNTEDKIVLRYKNLRGVGRIKEIKDKADFYIAVNVLDYYTSYVGYSPYLVIRAS